MTARDPRWENVYAKVGKNETDNEFFSEEVRRFSIWVPTPENGWFCHIIVPKNELDTFKGMYKATLVKMVEQVDLYMDGKGANQ